MAAKRKAPKKPRSKKRPAKKPTSKGPAPKKASAKRTLQRESRVLPAANAKPAAFIEEDDPRIEAGYRRLAAYWDEIGPSDTDLLTYVINPMFLGAPSWPNTRQSYRVVRPRGSLILASDGLSDPFVGTDMADTQGLGCEVYLEAPELAGADLDALRSSWAFAAVELIAQNIADAGGVSRLLEEYGVLSMELPLPEFPEHWRNEDGHVGCLINLPVKDRARRIEDMPFGAVDILCARLIAPSELARIRTGGDKAREELVRELASREDGHLTRLGSA